MSNKCKMIYACDFIGSGFPEEEGKNFANSIIDDADYLDWEHLQINFDYVSPIIFVSSFFNSFFGEFKDKRPDLIPFLDKIDWIARFQFQRDMIKRWLKNFASAGWSVEKLTRMAKRASQREEDAPDIGGYKRLPSWLTGEPEDLKKVAQEFCAEWNIEDDQIFHDLTNLLEETRKIDRERNSNRWEKAYWELSYALSEIDKAIDESSNDKNDPNYCSFYDAEFIPKLVVERVQAYVNRVNESRNSVFKVSDFSGLRMPINKWGEDLQIKICPSCSSPASPGKSGPRFSKMHDFACETSNKMYRMVGGGDQLNVLEAALEAAYCKGVNDAKKY